MSFWRPAEENFLVVLIYNVLAEKTTALTLYSKVILTSISTSSGLYLYRVPLHSSCDSYKKKCHIATLKLIFKNILT